LRLLEEESEMCLAVPGRVEQVYDAGGARMGKVNFGGIVKDVCLAYLPEIQVGDYTIVHVGFAISRIDEDSAQKTLQMFRDLGLLEEEFATEQQILQAGAGARGAMDPAENAILRDRRLFPRRG